MDKNLINKKLIQHLANLVRIRLDDNTNKLVGDLNNIVNSFKELENVNTNKVSLVSGGTDLKNIMREDENKEDNCLSNEEAIKDFPDEDNGYLKTPSVF